MKKFFLKEITPYRKDIFCCFLITAAISLMYGRTVGYSGEIWDDLFYLGMFRDGNSFAQLLFQLKRSVLGLYSPVVTLSFYLEHWFPFFSTPAASAHFWNIFYFLLSAWGLYWLFRELHLPGKEGRKWQFTPWWAAAAVLLWALHPQRIESVAWIAERKDVLLACCAWWAWALFIRSYRKKRFSTGAFLLFLISFGIKPALLLFPCAVGLWIFFETRSKNWRDYRFLLPWCAVSLFMGLFHLFQTDFSHGGADGRLPVILWNCGNYAVTALIPVGAAPFHPFFPEPGWNNFFILSLLLLFYCGAFLLFPRYRSNVLAGVGCAAAAAGLLLAVTCGAARVGNADWADRYNLLPSAMASLVLTAFAAAWWQSQRKAFSCAGGLLFGALFLWETALCHKQLPVWRNAQSVTEAALKAPVPNYRVLFIAILKALEKNDDAGCEALLKRLPAEEKLLPFDADTVRIFRSGLAAWRAFLKKQDLAGVDKVRQLLNDPAWHRITAISNGFPQMLLSRTAELLLQQGRTLEAAFVFERLSCCYLDDMEGYFYRGISLIFQQKYSEAVPFLEKAQQLAPKDTAVKYQLAFARKMSVSQKKGY